MVLRAIFTVDPKRNSNQAVIKCVAKVEADTEFSDEPVEQGKYELSENITVQFLWCRITDTFLLSTKTLPVINTVIVYQTALVTERLFNIYLDFTITTEITNESQLIKSVLDGEYSLRVQISETESRIIPIDRFESLNTLIENITALLETDEMKSIMSKVIEDNRLKRVETLGIDFDQIQIPKATYNLTELAAQYRQNGTINL